METQHKPTLKDEVYQQIIELICNGSIKTGEIITEKQLINHFGIQQSPRARGCSSSLATTTCSRAFPAAAIRSFRFRPKTFGI